MDGTTYNVFKLLKLLPTQWVKTNKQSQIVNQYLTVILETKFSIE